MNTDGSRFDLWLLAASALYVDPKHGIKTH
jgi:hypothetical protein